MAFCEEAEDAKTRLVALNGQVDTAAENWRMNAFFATFKHEMSNKDTAARIRRTLNNRYDQGGVVMTFMYGYIKPDGAKSDAEISKDPAAEPVIAEVFRRLEDGASFAEVADWLNETRVPTGKWVRAKKWTDGLVNSLVHNPLLKGVQVRNKKRSKRINKTGRYRKPRPVLAADRPGQRIDEDGTAPPPPVSIRTVARVPDLGTGRLGDLVDGSTTAS